jgi:hypothetical protein
VYSAITIDRDGQSHHGWRSFRFRDGRLYQTVFYLHRARHDDHEYAMPLGAESALAAIDEAARQLLEQLIEDARRAGDQPVPEGPTA